MSRGWVDSELLVQEQARKSPEKEASASWTGLQRRVRLRREAGPEVARDRKGPCGGAPQELALSLCHPAWDGLARCDGIPVQNRSRRRPSQPAWRAAGVEEPRPGTGPQTCTPTLPCPSGSSPQALECGIDCFVVFLKIAFSPSEYSDVIKLK